jgi:hypothetical protein
MKRIDFTKPFFECTGGGTEPRKYYIHDTLSIARFEVYEDVQMMLAKGRDYAAVFTSQKKIHDLLNQSKVADAAIENYNSMMLVKDKLEKRHHPALQLCALFANLEGEDMTKYDEVQINKKIDDWINEGYAMNDFFSLAFSFARDIMESYNEVLQDFSKPVAKSKVLKKSGVTASSDGQKS